MGGSSVEDIMENIKRIESSGNYQARGPKVTSGMYAGEQALGAYQIMPGNLPSWSKEALGREVTEDEFLSNPEIQDQIARYKMQQALDKYGNPEDVASVWFTGQPLAKAGGDIADVTGTTNNEYIRRFLGEDKPTIRKYVPLAARSQNRYAL